MFLFSCFSKPAQKSRKSNVSNSTLVVDSLEIPDRNHQLRKSIRNRSNSRLNRSNRNHFQSEYNFPSMNESVCQGFEVYKSLPKLDDFSLYQENYYFKNSDETRSIDIYDDSDLDIKSLPRNQFNSLQRSIVKSSGQFNSLQRSNISRKCQLSRNEDFRGSKKSVTFDRQVKVKYDHLLEMAESYATESETNKSLDSSDFEDSEKIDDFENFVDFSKIDSEEHVYESIPEDDNMVRYEELADERSAHMETLQMYYKLQDEFVKLQRAQCNYKSEGEKLKKWLPKRSFPKMTFEDRSFDRFMVMI